MDRAGLRVENGTPDREKSRSRDETGIARPRRCQRGAPKNNRRAPDAIPRPGAWHGRTGMIALRRRRDVNAAPRRENERRPRSIQRQSADGARPARDRKADGTRRFAPAVGAWRSGWLLVESPPAQCRNSAARKTGTSPHESGGVAPPSTQLTTRP